MTSHINIESGKFQEMPNGGRLYLEGSTFFTFDVQWHDQDKLWSIQDTSLSKRFCFGDLTRSVDKHFPLTGNVYIYYNNYSLDSTRFVRDTKRLATNIGTFIPEETLYNMFVTLRRSLQYYVSHGASVHNTDRLVFSYDGTHAAVMHKMICVEFRNIYYYELFFILNMYRRLVCLQNVRANLAAYELSIEHWHRLSFVQNLLLSDLDNSAETPWDSLIGLCYILGAKNMIRLIDPAIFKELKQKPELFGHSYMQTYQRMLSPDFSIARTNNEDIDFNQLRHYGIVATHRYRTLEDLKITTALPEDKEHMETYYRFLRKIVCQNKKKLQK